MAAAFRLMTANLLHERCDVSAFARILDEVNPDVVVTQELAPGPAEVLASAFPNHRLRPSLDFTGRGVAARLEVSFGEIEMPGRNGTSAVLSIDGHRVRLAGIHLVNPINFPWWVSARRRRLQLDGLFDWIGSADRPLVVAGDFNASPIWPAYRRMSAGLTDLVAELGESEGVTPEKTWAWRPGWPRMLRVDHVFGSGLRATASRVLEIPGSDHHAVVVDLVIV